MNITINSELALHVAKESNLLTKEISSNHIILYKYIWEIIR